MAASACCSEYYNRNSREALDIPVGPNNKKIEPGPIDQGQPTHFERPSVGRAGREGAEDFGKKTVTWTITANGETQAIPFALQSRPASRR
ncbi:MAG: hypothetical protein U0Q11_22965 [Vicinamibacterales bacterium]